ncbi:MAG: hypothetical protein AAGC60_01750 [Acidobacteriota bacterium]
MSRETRPTSRDDLELRQVGDEFLVYDPAADELVVLTAGAAAVLALADASRTPADIARALAAASGLDTEPVPGAVVADVEQALAALASGGLLAAGASVVD